MHKFTMECRTVALAHELPEHIISITVHQIREIVKTYLLQFTKINILSSNKARCI